MTRCGQCGIEFQRSKARIRYCSDLCAARALQRKKNANATARYARLRDALEQAEQEERK